MHQKKKHLRNLGPDTQPVVSKYRAKQLAKFHDSHDKPVKGCPLCEGGDHGSTQR